jgi:hypothetical protein
MTIFFIGLLICGAMHFVGLIADQKPLGKCEISAEKWEEYRVFREQCEIGEEIKWLRERAKFLAVLGCSEETNGAEE